LLYGYPGGTSTGHLACRVSTLRIDGSAILSFDHRCFGQPRSSEAVKQSENASIGDMLIASIGTQRSVGEPE
jgi:hypothetical protein